MDERKLEELNVNWLRRQIGYVRQQPTLFNGTVRQNMLLGKQDATQEEMIAAARAAHAHDFVMQLNHGYVAALSGIDEIGLTHCLVLHPLVISRIVE
jgi:ABC-type multidrug transport system fused ATPase/permease subunit